MKTNRLVLLAIPALGAAACNTGGERTGGKCPQGETCSPDTPNGLYFQGPVVDSYDTLSSGVQPIAVGGTETVKVVTGSLEGAPAFDRQFDAATTGTALTITSTTPPTVTLQAAALGNGYLRILQSGTNLLYDRVAMETQELDHIDVLPQELTTRDNLDFDPASTPWAAWAGVDVPVYIALYDGVNTRLVDESLSVAGADQVSWDVVNINAIGGKVNFTVTAGDKTALPASVDIVSHVATIAAVKSIGIDPTQPQNLSAGRVLVCFEALADAKTVIAGAPWSFGVTGGAATVEFTQPSEELPNCTYVNPNNSAATVMIDVGAGDANAQIPLQFVAGKPSHEPVVNDVTPVAAATPGERAL